MDQLLIKKLTSNNRISFSEAENLLEDQTELNYISTINWDEFAYRPKVRFRISHTGNDILLKFYVRENHIRAMETSTNGDVYKDSCVEFFITHDGVNYYNFEFSCIGTIHLAWGPDRHNRKFVEPTVVRTIDIRSSLGNKPIDKMSGEYDWEMMIRIPAGCFAYSKLTSFNNLSAAANFYKCGDETAEPHFVTWNPVGTSQPDYHRPEYFGKVHFE